MLEAEALPLAVSDQVVDIAGEAIQAAFKVIADRLDEVGYPVTGDITPDETVELEHAFQGYVLAMALNNPTIARMQDSIPGLDR
jgi:hypothetical protein